MKNSLALLTILAVLMTGCSALQYVDERRVNKPTDMLHGPGMACEELSYAKTHERVRNDKNASPYEIAAVMKLAGCANITSDGLPVLILSGPSWGFYQIAHSDPRRHFIPMWVPARLLVDRSASN